MRPTVASRWDGGGNGSFKFNIWTFLVIGFIRSIRITLTGLIKNGSLSSSSRRLLCSGGGNKWGMKVNVRRKDIWQVIGWGRSTDDVEYGL